MEVPLLCVRGANLLGISVFVSIWTLTFQGARPMLTILLKGPCILQSLNLDSTLMHRCRSGV